MLSQNMVSMSILKKDYAKIETLGGTVFNIVQKGKLFFSITLE